MAEAEIRKCISEDIEKTLKRLLLVGEMAILKAEALQLRMVFKNFITTAVEILNEEMVKIAEEKGVVLKKAIDDGRKQGMEELNKIIGNLIKQQELFFQRIESSVMDMIIPICEKVLEHELSVNPETICAIIKNELKRICSDGIKLVLNNDDFMKLSACSPEFFKGMNNSRVEIIPSNSVAPGDCILKCDSGDIYTGVKYRLSKIKEIIDEDGL